MIHYHGLPITPAATASRIVSGRHAFVSFAHLEQVGLAIEVCQSWALDNGAFSAWMARKTVDWQQFYAFCEEMKRVPNCDWAVIPDVIDGDEAANDALLAAWPHGSFGVPVWHLHESLGRLERLVHAWPRIAIGSSGDYAIVGNQKWWMRMAEVMRVVCDAEGRPLTKLHGLRMLNPGIFSRFPFASADSTNIARNIGIDSAWRGTYTPPSKEVRGLVMAERIESVQASVTWKHQMIPFTQQERLFA